MFGSLIVLYYLCIRKSGEKTAICIWCPRASVVVSRTKVENVPKIFAQGERLPYLRFGKRNVGMVVDIVQKERNASTTVYQPQSTLHVPSS